MGVRTIQGMALTVGDREIRPLTADEVMRMVEAGILEDGERVELLHGALTRMTGQSPGHVEVVTKLLRWLDPTGNAARFVVRAQHPLVVADETSLPEPDIAVVEPGDYARRHPSSALLVIEVAVSSLRTDTKIKPALYAATGVPELWVMDVDGRHVRIFSEPGPDGYAAERVAGPDERLRPRAVDVAPLDLAALFAGL